MVLEKMALNAEGFPEPTGEVRGAHADALVLALGQDTDLSLLDRAPVSGSPTASSQWSSQ